MTLEDFLILLILVNLAVSLLVLVRIGGVQRELTRLRRMRSVYRGTDKKRGRPPNKRSLPF